MFTLTVDDEIELRLHDVRYAEDFFKLIDRNRKHLRQYLDWEKYHQSVEDTIKYIKLERKNFAKREVVATQIIYRGEFAGSIGLMIHNWANGHGEIGYWLGESFIGKGIITRAARALTNYGFNTLGLHKIIIRMVTDNEKSKAVPIRLGFKHEGIQIHQSLLHEKYRDFNVYYVLADEWESKNILEFSYQIDEHMALRLHQPHHADVIFALTDANRDYLLSWLPWADAPTLESTQDHIKDSLQQYGDYDGLQCSIWYDGEICGAIGYHYWDLQNGKAEIGYWLAENFTSKGIMTKAVRVLVSYIFEIVGLHRVEVNCAVGNEKSAAIPIRLGFTHEGMIRSGTKQQDEFADLNIYAILSHEWKA